jgi:drug/metabolite transporter (DMT)-like permease
VEKPFAKPIVMLLLMFCSMSPSMLFWFIQQRFLIKPEDRDVVPMKTLIILIIPCICDLMCTLLLLVAQLYITASMWQMLRGSVIIITAVLKCNVLNIQLKRHMWIGVFVITIAMLLVASTSFLNPAASGTNPEEDPADAKDPRVGVLLVVIGCLAQGVQCKFCVCRSPMAPSPSFL